MKILATAKCKKVSKILGNNHIDFNNIRLTVVGFFHGWTTHLIIFTFIYS